MSQFDLDGLGIPARNIFGIGRNYALHAKELGNQVPSTPLVFLKPTSALAGTGATIALPRDSARVDYEAEIVVAIGRKLSHANEAEAEAAIAGYAIGLDLTARDLQEEAKKKGLPWALAKGQDKFAPIGNFVSAAAIPSASRLTLFNDVNGARRQHGRASDMVFSIPHLISYLSGRFSLDAGDLIFTGTPEGVGPLKAGDEIRAGLQLDGVGELLSNLDFFVAP